MAINRGWTDISPDTFILRVQQRAEPQDYDMVKGRVTTLSKNKLVEKAWERCDRER